MYYLIQHIVINNKYSFVVYDVPPTCFGLYKAIVREVV